MGKKVVVVDYQTEWATQFTQLKEKLWPSLKEVAISIEHVGSTSVPGLAAKAVLDVDVVVDSEKELPQAIKLLEELGYKHRGDLGIKGREAFYAPEGSYRQHLYLVTKNCNPFQNHIKLRDRLRNDPVALAEYAELKKNLAVKFSNSIDDYIDGKTEFILKLLLDEGVDQKDLDTIELQNRKIES